MCRRCGVRAMVFSVKRKEDGEAECWGERGQGEARGGSRDQTMWGLMGHGQGLGISIRVWVLVL